jgi:hypothetical protein
MAGLQALVIALFTVSYTNVCKTQLGVPLKWPDSPPKKDLEEFISYENLKNWELDMKNSPETFRNKYH